MSDITDFLDGILSAGESGRWVVFWKRTVLIFFLVSSADFVAKPLLIKVLDLSIESKKVLLVLSYILPIALNAAYFFWSRFPGARLFFSRKTNIVFAYNLKGVNEERFLKKYRALIEQVRNEIDSLEMGRKINVIQAPSDTRFKDRSAAEAKVLLGLRGSVLLVWGSVTQDHGRTRFKTSFSYELGHPRGCEPDRARDEVTSLINNVMRQGLFSAFKVDEASFRDQMIPTVFFILAVTTSSLGLFDRSEQFISAFNKWYSSADLVRKRDLGPAYINCRNLRKAIYLARYPRLTIFSKKSDLDETLELSRRILELDPGCYDAWIKNAYTLYRQGDHAGAERSNQEAEKIAPRRVNLHRFNKAFFALRRQGYLEALSEYESIPDQDSVATSDVSNFLDEQFNISKDPAFLFADGYVSMRWGDEKIGKKSLKRFIKIAHSDLLLAPLLEKAKELVGS